MVKIGDIVNNNKHLCNFYPLRPWVNMNMASENVLISYNTKTQDWDKPDDVFFAKQIC